MLRTLTRALPSRVWGLSAISCTKLVVASKRCVKHLRTDKSVPAAWPSSSRHEKARVSSCFLEAL